MNTIGWALILAAVYLIRSLFHGGIVDETGKFVLLDRLQANFVGLVTGKPVSDTAQATGILAPTPALQSPSASTGSPNGTTGPPSVWASNPNSVNDALAYAENQKNHGSAVWPRRCLAFVARAYGLLGSGSPTALSLWNAMPNELKNSSATGIPTGALLFYSTGSPFGHVALYAGSAEVYSTDIMRLGHVDKVSQNELTNGKWRLHYLGWTPPYFPNNSNSKRVSGD